MILKNVKKLSNLVSNILKLNKLENQEIYPEKKLFDLSARVASAFLSFVDASEEFVRNILEVPDNIRILCIVTFGFKDEVRKPYEVEKCKWEKVHIAKWKASEE